MLGIRHWLLLEILVSWWLIFRKVPRVMATTVNATEAESNILIFFLRARQSPHGMRYGVGNGSLEGERGGGDGYREEG